MAKKSSTSPASRAAKPHGRRKSTSTKASGAAARGSGKAASAKARKATGKKATNKAAKKTTKGGGGKKAAGGKVTTTKKKSAKRPSATAGKAAASKKATGKSGGPRPKAAPKKAAPKKAAATSRKAPPTPRKRAGGKKGPGKNPLVFVDHTSEDLFAAQLLEELEFRHGIDVATLDVRIRDGIAIARGCVSDLDELEAVRDTMQDAGGITDLTFVVQVAPDRREADRDRARHIQESLDGEADLAAENILVACVGRKAILRGTVSSRVGKVKAGLLALRAGEVARLANRLVVLSEA